MSKHEHVEECPHDSLEYCKRCDVVYCCRCGREWGDVCCYLNGAADSLVWPLPYDSTGTGTVPIKSVPVWTWQHGHKG